jgi:hypothetical protein
VAAEWLKGRCCDQSCSWQQNTLTAKLLVLSTHKAIFYYLGMMCLSCDRTAAVERGKLCVDCLKSSYNVAVDVM